MNPWIKKLPIYEPGRPIEDLANELGEDPRSIIKLASNENALGPSPLSVEAIQRALSTVHLYPDGGNCHLREALAEKHRLHPDQFLMGNGSNEMIELVGHAYLDQASNIVMGEPAFLVYKLVAALFDVGVHAIPLKSFRHDLDGMLAGIDEKTKIVFISNPNNPTGTMVNEEAIDEFMGQLPAHILVVFDEAYIELLSPNVQPNTIKYVQEGRRVCLLRTFSKTYGLAGLRIGYAIAPKEIIGLLSRVRQPFNVNTLAQVAALAALKDEDHVARTRDLVSDGLKYYAASFKKLKLAYVPSVTNFILVNVGSGREVFEALQRQRIIVRPMDAYGLPEYVRITVGTRDQNMKVIEAIKKTLNHKCLQLQADSPRRK
ncbi:MAG: histidinol-phosphate transaminase [Kiritimatiellae bacterium]|nr:histidinol-phosphate transaminase [Kiritimatiellia bacterium]